MQLKLVSKPLPFPGWFCMYNSPSTVFVSLPSIPGVPAYENCKTIKLFSKMLSFLSHPLYKNLTIVYIYSPLWGFCYFAGTDPALFYDSIYEKSSNSLQWVFHVTYSNQSKEKIKRMFNFLMGFILSWVSWGITQELNKKQVSLSICESKISQTCSQLKQRWL